MRRRLRGRCADGREPVHHPQAHQASCDRTNPSEARARRARQADCRKSKPANPDWFKHDRAHRAAADAQARRRHGHCHAQDGADGADSRIAARPGLRKLRRAELPGAGGGRGSRAGNRDGLRFQAPRERPAACGRDVASLSEKVPPAMGHTDKKPAEDNAIGEHSPEAWA